MVDAATVVSLIGALGIGSVAGQYAASGGQRRQTRADVLKALHHTERARWVNGEPDDPPFPAAMRELETAALLARIPREGVLDYKVLAYAAFWSSGEAFEELSEDDAEQYGGGIESKFATLVREAAEDLSKLVWSPWLARPGLGRRIANREARYGGLAEGREKAALNRARQYNRL
jgi:hypothetical protein